MAIAAVPKYLGSDFSSAAPGHRFGMYLKLWGMDARTKNQLWTTHDVNYRTTGPQREERPFRDENKTAALQDALRLTSSDKAAMQALAQRQAALARPLERNGQLHVYLAESISPFSTGLGNEHPMENGFAFLNPYGLPYLAGSGVKGVLRTAARELADGEFGASAGWSHAAIEALFGKESGDQDVKHQRGALMFWDVIPRIKGDTLKVEVMTPHQSHYYQNGETPHDSGLPRPINFLIVPPGSEFSFCVQCNGPFLSRLAPGLADGGQWKTLLHSAFIHAFDWLGFGAKTAVGYGAMRASGSSYGQAKITASASTPGSPSVAAAPAGPQRWENAMVTWHKGKAELSCTTAAGIAFTLPGKGKALFESLGEVTRAALLKGKPVHVAVLEVESIGGRNFRIAKILESG